MLSLLPETVSVPLVFAVLFHDVAKPVTATVDKTGRFVSTNMTASGRK
jgi:hypothetical protein